MKRWLMIGLVLLGVCVSAQAEPYIYSSDHVLFPENERHRSQIAHHLSEALNE